jgi:hypothetical protein
MAAMVAAMAAGYCLHRLPVRAVVIAQIRLLSALVPPALLLYGAVKANELLHKQITPQPS